MPATPVAVPRRSSGGPTFTAMRMSTKTAAYPVRAVQAVQPSASRVMTDDLLFIAGMGDPGPCVRRSSRRIASKPTGQRRLHHGLELRSGW